MGSFRRVSVNIASEVEITQSPTLYRTRLEPFSGWPTTREADRHPGLDTLEGVISLQRRRKRDEIASVK